METVAAALLGRPCRGACPPEAGGKNCDSHAAVLPPPFCPHFDRISKMGGEAVGRVFIITARNGGVSEEKGGVFRTSKPAFRCGHLPCDANGYLDFGQRAAGGREDSDSACCWPPALAAWPARRSRLARGPASSLRRVHNMLSSRTTASLCTPSESTTCCHLVQQPLFALPASPQHVVISVQQPLFALPLLISTTLVLSLHCLPSYLHQHSPRLTTS